MAVLGGAGDDRILGLGTTSADLAALGLDGSPATTRGSGGDSESSDPYRGGPGDDVLIGRGNDRLSGGPGRDTMYQSTKSRRWPGGCDETPPGLCWPIIN
jgi:Ca2+-binding RTX toxin-like protein